MKSTGEKRTLVVRVLRQSDLNLLGKLLSSRADVAFDDTYIWLRYQSDDEFVRSVAACIGGHHFRVIDNDLLVPLGSSVATERLPELEWVRLAKAIDFRLPTAALSGRFSAGELHGLRLLRGSVERPASAGLYLLDELVDWIDSAPQFRLQRLAACVAGNEVLVIGDPLPTIAGEFLCQEERLLTPAGMTWYPRIDAEHVLEHFDVAADQLMLWTETNKWSTIPIEIIRPLQRASIRAYLSKRSFEQRV